MSEMKRMEAKIVFLGESAVGKTSIISAFFHNEFKAEHQPTVGACFSLQKIMIDGTEVKLKIWDTAGQERFRALTPMYYRDCHVAILVFSVDSQQSLNELQNWYNDIKADSHVMPSIIVVGNKIDLPRAVSTQVGEQFAESISATYMECSAIEDKGIYDIFVEAGTLSLNKNLPQNQEKITRDITGDQTQKKCC